MFSLGDKVVYPMHGAGKIEAVENKEILGNTKEYFVLKMPLGDVKLMIPVDNVENMGLRTIIGIDDVSAVYQMISETSALSNANWNKRYRENMEKMKTGDIFEIANVVSDLAHREHDKGLSTGEKKMFISAKQMIVSELHLTTEESEEAIVVKIEESITQQLD